MMVAGRRHSEHLVAVGPCKQGGGAGDDGGSQGTRLLPHVRLVVGVHDAHHVPEVVCPPLLACLIPPRMVLRAQPWTLSCSLLPRAIFLLFNPTWLRKACLTDIRVSPWSYLRLPLPAKLRCLRCCGKMEALVPEVV